MLILSSYDIVFQEIPGEVTLALNLAGCPNRCPDCHSPHLQNPEGEPLTDDLLEALVEKYGTAITCVAFMGGDGDPREVNCLAARIKSETNLKTAWYSGREELPPEVETANFDFIKTGPYDPMRGGLDTEGTNQRFWRIEKGKMIDSTEVFHKKSSNFVAR